MPLHSSNKISVRFNDWIKIMLVNIKLHVKEKSPTPEKDLKMQSFSISKTDLNSDGDYNINFIL
jgi:hypothetical protein